MGVVLVRHGRASHGEKRVSCFLQHITRWLDDFDRQPVSAIREVRASCVFFSFREKGIQQIDTLS